MGREGENQREALQGAAQEMQQTMANFAVSMESLIETLRGEQTKFEEKQQKQLENLGAAFTQMNNEQSQNMNKASGDMVEVLATFRDGVREELGRQAEDMGKVADSVHTSLSNMSTAMQGFFENLDQH